MKKIKLLFLLLLFPLAINAQIIKAETAYYSDPRIEIDTLHFYSGKPQVFLIQIKDPSDYLDSSELVERNELRRNFDSSDFEFNFITKHSFLRFENGQFIDVSDPNNTYGAVVFWTGNSSDKVKLQEGVRLATEFVSAQLNLNKKSSYIVNSEFYKKEIAQLSKKDDFTKDSEKVMNLFLEKYSVPEVCTINDQNIFNRNSDKVKTLTGFLVNSKGKKIKHEEFSFNEKGHPTRIIRFDDDGKTVYYTTTFNYENGILKSITKNDRVDHIKYNNNQLFYTSDLGGGNETTIFELNDGALLMKRILIMNNDEGQEERNFIVEQRIENDCIHYYINNELWTIDCSSEIGKFPYTHKYTSFQNGEVLQTIDYKVNKIDNSKFQIQSKSSESNSNGTTTILLNDHGLVESLTYKEGNETEKYQIEYSYYE
nr:hypothetical protein [uncultured Flavobacterium sp.]